MTRARLRAGRDISYQATAEEAAGLTYGAEGDRWPGSIVAVQRGGAAVIAVQRPDGKRFTKTSTQGNFPGQFTFALVTRGSHPAVTPTVDLRTSEGRLDLYLAPDAASASDAHPGTTAAEPLATLDGLIARLNGLSRVDDPVVVHCASAPVNGATSYRWNACLGSIDLNAPLIFIGDGAGQAGDDGFTELLTGTLSGVPTVTDFPITGGGLTIDAFLGKGFHITSGTQAGFVRSLNGNTVTDVQVANSVLVAPAAGDSFRITEPSVRFSLGDFGPDIALYSPNFTSKVSGVGKGSPYTGSQGTGFLQTTSMLYFINIRFGVDVPAGGVTGQMALAESMACFVGCEAIGSEVVANLGVQFRSGGRSGLVSGLDFYFSGAHLEGPRLAGLSPAADNRAWAGWGLFFDDNGNNGIQGLDRFAGFVYSNDELTLQGTRALFLGGRISAAGRDAPALDLWRGAYVIVEAVSSFQLFRCDCDENAGGSATVVVRDNSQMQSGGGLYQKDNAGHVFMVLSGGSGQGALPGKLSLSSSDTLEAIATLTQPTNAVRTTGGGRVNFRPTPTIIGTFDDEFATVRNESAAPAAGAGGDASALAAEGDAYPTAASGIDGRHGWIIRA